MARFEGTLIKQSLYVFIPEKKKSILKTVGGVVKIIYHMLKDILKRDQWVRSQLSQRIVKNTKSL